MTAVVVLGAGAWGTAIACHLAARAAVNPAVTLWARDRAQAELLDTARENARYLPGVALPNALRVTADLGGVEHADVLVAAVPVAALTDLVTRLSAAGARAPLVMLAKGFIAAPTQPAGVGLIHQQIAPLWPAPVAVASGPSFAEEVARGLPTALAVAATDPALATQVAALLRGDTLRAYESDDIAGVEVGGAIKNVLAIAAGASDGLGFGHNARAALITRGLAETGRLSTAAGGHRETLMGLAGLGDLVLTCTDDHSRNRRFGLKLAQGLAVELALFEIGQVVEGFHAAAALRRVAAREQVVMPIAEGIYGVLYDKLPAENVVHGLMMRPIRPEFD